MSPVETVKLLLGISMGSLLCIWSLTCEQLFGGRCLAFMGRAAPPSSGCGAEQPEVAPALKPRLSPSLPSSVSKSRCGWTGPQEAGCRVGKSDQTLCANLSPALTERKNCLSKTQLISCVSLSVFTHCQSRPGLALCRLT